MSKSTGIFYIGFPSTVDIKSIDSKIKDQFPEVKYSWQSNGTLLPEHAEIRNQIEQNKISKVVLAGIRPGFHKSYFTKAIFDAGTSQIKVSVADLFEYSQEPDEDIAIQAIHNAISESIPKAKSTGEKYLSDTLVIGGGIAGIQAALEIAEAGYKTYILEKTATIGGHMAMFDKTFPTLDCAACILTPKMGEAGQHPNIELLTYSELEDVEGESGAFKVSVKKKAKYVDVDICIGCGICAEKCPAKVESEFDAGTTLRKSIYIPFPQAVPNKYIIDKESCRFILEGKCGTCAKVCPKECIDFEEKDEIITLNVGNIILATGFKLFDASSIEEFGYGKFMNVLTSLEFERLVNAAGPTEGLIRNRTTDKKGNKVFIPESEEPKSFAVIHCVGSRDMNHNKHCSKVCCMYSLKLAHLIREKIPDAEIYEYFIDMRAFGKGYEEFYQRIKNENVNMIRGRTATVKEIKGKLMLRSEDMISGRIIEQQTDMVILSCGLEPANGTKELAQKLDLGLDESGWFQELNSIGDPVNTSVEGITIAGLCQGPKDIPDTVAQASAAAASVIKNIIASNGK